MVVSAMKIELEDVRRLALKSGDVLVVRLDRWVEPRRVAEISDILHRMVPGHEVMVLGPGAEIEVLEPQP